MHRRFRFHVLLLSTQQQKKPFANDIIQLNSPPARIAVFFTPSEFKYEDDLLG